MPTPSEDRDLIGGRERRRIVLVPSDSRWPTAFAARREALADALAGIAVRIEHIGSTAVPGLIAKPIVDIQVAVPDPADEARFGPPLERLGYRLRVRERGHRMYRTPELDVHLHLWSAGGQDERRHLLFRDWLRCNAADRTRYAEVKGALAARDWQDMNDYAQAKTEVIAEITGRAEAWAARTGWALPAPLS